MVRCYVLSSSLVQSCFTDIASWKEQGGDQKLHSKDRLVLIALNRRFILLFSRS